MGLAVSQLLFRSADESSVHQAEVAGTDPSASGGFAPGSVERHHYHSPFNGCVRTHYVEGVDRRRVNDSRAHILCGWNYTCLARADSICPAGMFIPVRCRKWTWAPLDNSYKVNNSMNFSLTSCEGNGRSCRKRESNSKHDSFHGLSSVRLRRVKIRSFLLARVAMFYLLVGTGNPSCASSHQFFRRIGKCEGGLGSFRIRKILQNIS